MSKVKLKQQKRRSEIIELLIPMIQSVPFDELSVTDMCVSAGISVGTFYHYFTKKSDILIGLLSLIDDDLETGVFPLLTSGDEAENLRIFAHGWAEHVRLHGNERSKLISSVAPSNTDYNGQKRVSVAKLEEIFSRGQQKGQFTAEKTAPQLTELFLLALRAVSTDWSRCDGAYSVTERMDEFMALFIRGLKP